MNKHRLPKDIIIYFTFIVLGLYLSVFQRALDDIAQYYDFVAAFKGILVTGHFAGILVMPLVSGELADKLGRKPVTLLGFGLFLLGLGSALLTANPYVYVFSVFLIGGATGVIELSLTAVLMDNNRGNESTVINISQTIFVAGALLGPLMVSLFVNKGYDWRHIYAVFAGFSIMYIIYFSLVPAPKKELHPDKMSGIFVLKLIRKPLMITFIIGMFMYVGIEQAIAFYINTYIKTITPSEFIPSLVLSGFYGFMIAGRLSCAYLSRKFDSRKLIIIMILFSAATILMIIFTEGYVLAGTGFALLGLGMSGVWPLLIYLASSSFPRYSGTSIGIMHASGALGGMTIPFLLNAAGTAFGPNIGVSTFLLPAAVIVASQLIIIRKNNFSK